MVKNMKFEQRLQNIPDNIWSIITQIDQMQGQWIAGVKLGPQVLGRLKKSVLITSTGASTRIEGAKLSDENIEKMMRGISMQKFTNRDKQEVQGYYELLENVFNSWKTLSFNEGTIKHFHSELLKYVNKDQEHKGDYKKEENQVNMINEAGESVGVLFNTTKAYLTSKEMQELLEWTDDALIKIKYHTLLIVANFIVEFLKIHPFKDGNGRISRVLTNLLLLREGYEYMPYVSHEKLVEDNKPEYYISLRRGQKALGSGKEDISDWLKFFFTIILKQSQMAVDLFSRENVEKLLSLKQLAVWNYLQEINKSATPMEIAKNTKVAQPTVRQALNKLMRLKKVERVGQGRSTSYRKL
jgi:Fic family protein